MRIGKLKVNHYINYVVIGLITLIMGTITLAGGRIDNSTLFLMEKMAISIILAVSLSLVVGFLGELSLGHAGFMCVGAYLGGKVSTLLLPVLGNSIANFVISLLAGSTKGFLGKLLSKHASNYNSSVFMNLIRMLICIFIGFGILITVPAINAHFGDGAVFV